MARRTRVDGHGGNSARGSTPQVRAPATLTRRRFVAASGLVPAAVGARSAGAAGVDAFLRLSAKLTGFPVAALDQEFARNLLEALTFPFPGRAAAVEALVLGKDTFDRASLEAEIVSAWYSGLLPGDTVPVVATVRDALIWRVLGFATPPGACAGAASWDGPPPGEKR